MLLRPYHPHDNEALFRLFYDTVHTINAADYPAEELAVWARRDTDIAAWCHPFAESYTLVAETEHTIIGFGNMTADGELDRLYVHKNYQRRGVATAVVDALEAYAARQELGHIRTFASLTAKPFFLARGYAPVRENLVPRGGLLLKNYEMRKTL